MSGRMPQVVVHRPNILNCKSFFSVRLNSRKQLDSKIPYVVSSLVPGHVQEKLCLGRLKFLPMVKCNHAFGPSSTKVADEYGEDLSEEDDDLCPVECVREFKTDEEFCRILDKAKETGSLVVVDFYRTSCGSCKYIEQGFAKVCKKSGDKEAPVIFLKHNVSMLSL